jgi:probable F420-dependent oxidoreductase
VARERLGPGKYLAVEQAVVLDASPEAAREAAREHVDLYVRRAPHHQANLRRLGFTDADLADGGSDRLVDALVATGEQAAAARVRAHLDAGADHVCVQVLARTGKSYRRLADLVL